jgi:hypothetical protein
LSNLFHQNLWLALHGGLNDGHAVHGQRTEYIFVGEWISGRERYKPSLDKNADKFGVDFEVRLLDCGLVVEDLLQQFPDVWCFAG